MCCTLSVGPLLVPRTLKHKSLLVHMKTHCKLLLVCRPVDDTQQLVAQATEVDGVKWMPLEEYASNPFSATKPLYNKLVQQCVAYANGTYTGMKASSMNSGRGDRVELLRHGTDSPKL